MVDSPSPDLSPPLAPHRNRFLYASQENSGFHSEIAASLRCLETPQDNDFAVMNGPLNDGERRPEACHGNDFELLNGTVNDGEKRPGNGLGESEGESERAALEMERAGCSSSSGLGDEENMDWRAVERCITSSLKAFAIGASLRGGLSLFSLLTRLNKKRFKGRESLQKPPAELIKSVLKEALRYGLFLGSFAGTFSTVDELIAAFGGFKRTARWRTLVAGAIAGPSLLLTGTNVRHTSMAIYILLRAAVLAARCGIKSEQFGWMCRPLAWKHGDVFLMCLSSSQILSAWILKPESLPSSYISFLNKHGGKDVSVVKTLKELAFKEPLTYLEAVEKYYKSMDMDVQLDPNMSIPCRVVHGHQDCVPHFFRFLGQAYLRSLPVYLPVYLIPAIIVHRQGLLKKPLPIFSKTLLGTARSSLFLSAYCASAWLWTCMLFRTVRVCNPAVVAMGTFPTGLAVMIEKKSRRMEIALYCFARALESFAICYGDGGLAHLNLKAKVPKRMDVVLFSIATSIIMHCYAQEREVFRSKYLNVLDWVFGIPHDGPPIMQPPLVKVSSMSYLLGGRQGTSIPSSTSL